MALIQPTFAQDATDFTPGEARSEAVSALASGNNRTALILAQALLLRDENDVDALLLASRAARNSGDFDAARNFGRRAWQASNTRVERHASALVMAQAVSSAGNRTGAQLWLRRAIDQAPDDAARARAIRDFRYVRARNPLALEFAFNVKPTSNVNNGSARSTTRIAGLPFDFQLSASAQALSGMEYSAGVGGRYRFAQTANYAHDLTFLVNYRTFTLSEESRAAAPNVSGSDFAFGQVSAGYAYHRTPAEWIGPFTLSVSGGRSWYGGAPYTDVLRFNGLQTIPISPQTTLFFTAGAERQYGRATENADVVRAGARVRRIIPNYGTFGLGVFVAKSYSGLDIAEYTEIRMGTDYTFAQPILGADLSIAFSLRDRDYPRSIFSLDGRQDTEITASATVTFPDLERFGFQPSMTLSAGRNASNINLYDVDRLSVSFGLRSAF